MRYSKHTSESVSNGHPDKIADQISDAVLDCVLAQDPNARVACEALLKDGLVVVAGEITANAEINYRQIIGEVFEDIYLGEVPNFELLVRVGKQSPEIAKGIDQSDLIGAGDQGIMYGYASKETETYMPSPIYWAHQLMLAHRKLRLKDQRILADAKAQVTVAYDGEKPIGIEHIVVSSQHSASLSLEELRDILQNELIASVIPKDLLLPNIQCWINPSGSFLQGGPDADCGLTGRKLMVDTYGGFSLHGGGAFSGKDSTKVDRTAAYMARYVAKHIVASGLASRCEVCLAYAIGVEKPVMIDIDTFETAIVDKQVILDIIKKVFDFRPKAMIAHLGLTQPVFGKTATYGHFGRKDQDFSWERLDLLDQFYGIKD
jgi:S-adenosylmethionine synthetase